MKDKLIRIVDALDKTKVPLIAKSFILAIIQRQPEDTLESFVNDTLTMLSALEADPASNEMLKRRGVDPNEVRQFFN